MKNGRETEIRWHTKGSCLTKKAREAPILAGLRACAICAMYFYLFIEIKK